MDTTVLTEMIDPVTEEILDERQIAEQLLAQAKARGVGPVQMKSLGIERARSSR